MGAMWRLLYALQALSKPWPAFPCHGAMPPGSTGTQDEMLVVLAKLFAGSPNTPTRAVLLHCAGGHLNFASLSQHAQPFVVSCWAARHGMRFH